MGNNITLTASMRSNLSSLQNLSKALQTTQTRLSTGKKVNSALDDPATFYQASSLNQRVAALDKMLDAMGQGIQTIATANTGIETGLQMIEQMKNVITQARENVKVTTETTPAVEEIGHMEYGALHNGKAYTQAIVDQIGEKGLAAYAANQFYAPGTDPHDELIGQGQWYLPAIGEWMDLCGYDGEVWVMQALETNQEPFFNLNEEYNSFTDNLYTVNNTLDALDRSGVETSYLGWGCSYWSSSESESDSTWSFGTGSGIGCWMTHTSKTSRDMQCIRFSLALENCFTPTDDNPAPQIGDVMYSDLSYSDKDHIDTSKTAIGIVYWTSADSKSAKIINLKDIHYNYDNEIDDGVYIFDPENPYAPNNSVCEIPWCAQDCEDEDITAIPNFVLGWDDETGQTIINLDMIEWNSGTWVVDTEGQAGETITTYDFGDYQNQFAGVMQQYDGIIGDCAYQGVNLLNGRDLKLQFRENNGQEFVIKALNADSAGFELTADWSNLEDLDAVTAKLDIMAAQLQAYAQELSNAANIIQIRQNFTDAMMDILQVGADNLVLADMNEESANYLALQTRQQLAINALALAAQSDQSILKLFN